MLMPQTIGHQIGLEATTLCPSLLTDSNDIACTTPMQVSPKPATRREYSENTVYRSL